MLSKRRFGGRLRSAPTASSSIRSRSRARSSREPMPRSDRSHNMPTPHALPTRSASASTPVTISISRISSSFAICRFSTKSRLATRSCHEPSSSASPRSSENTWMSLRRVRNPARISLAAALALSFAAGHGARAAASHPVTFRTDDGVTIAGTLYEAARRPAPAVILLHMLTRSRDDWQSFADRLADAGISALAIDFRGHGQSTRGPAGPDGEPDLARMTLDVQAARAYLASHPDLVALTHIGIAGASIGANVAILEAASDPAIKSLALLSPGLNYRALRAEAAMQKYSPRPVLF